MPNVRVLLAEVAHRALETPWEVIRLGFKLKPPTVGLALAVVFHGLPVVIDDQVGDVNVTRGQLVERIE